MSKNQLFKRGSNFYYKKPNGTYKKIEFIKTYF